MAITEIDGVRQIQDETVGRAKLIQNFLEGSNLNLTDGANDATIEGLAAGAVPNAAVNLAQMQAAIAAAIAGGMQYKGVLDASDLTGAALDGAVTGDQYLISVAGDLDGLGFSIGDHLIVNADITDFSVDGSGKIDKVDNTESTDILRTGDVVDDLTTGGTAVPLSAQQGVVLKGLVDNLATDFAERVFGEAPTVTNGSPTIGALANIPVTNVRVYWNGIRAQEGAGNDYTLNPTTGVITLSENAKAKTKILVDYEY